jgi:hypothetical protein
MILTLCGAVFFLLLRKSANTALIYLLCLSLVGGIEFMPTEPTEPAEPAEPADAAEPAEPAEPADAAVPDPPVRFGYTMYPMCFLSLASLMA